MVRERRLNSWGENGLVDCQYKDHLRSSLSLAVHPTICLLLHSHRLQVLLTHFHKKHNYESKVTKGPAIYQKAMRWLKLNRAGRTMELENLIGSDSKYQRGVEFLDWLSLIWQERKVKKGRVTIFFPPDDGEKNQLTGFAVQSKFTFSHLSKWGHAVQQ